MFWVEERGFASTMLQDNRELSIKPAKTTLMYYIIVQQNLTVHDKEHSHGTSQTYHRPWSGPGKASLS